jgi:hypothetical protein
MGFLFLVTLTTRGRDKNFNRVIAIVLPPFSIDSKLASAIQPLCLCFHNFYSTVLVLDDASERRATLSLCVAAGPDFGGLRRYAELLVDNRPFTEAELTLFDENAEYAYQSFRNKAAESRNMPVEAMQEVAQVMLLAIVSYIAIVLWQVV